MKLSYKFGEKAYEVTGDNLCVIRDKLVEKTHHDARQIYRGLRHIVRGNAQGFVEVGKNLDGIEPLKFTSISGKPVVVAKPAAKKVVAKAKTAAKTSAKKVAAKPAVKKIVAKMKNLSQPANVPAIDDIEKMLA